jgi:transposase
MSGNALANGRSRGGAAYVDGFGTARRIQALCRLGWSLAEQAHITGRTIAEFEVLILAEPVPTRVAYLIDALYQRLSTSGWRRSASAERIRAEAARRGWAPPLEWAADTIDDPAAVPASTPGSGPERLRAWLVNYQTLDAQGLSRKEIAFKLRTTPELIKDRLRRARHNGFLPQVSPARQSRNAEVDRQDRMVRDLYRQDLNDSEIAERSGLTFGQVRYIRGTRLGLPAKFGSRGRRIVQPAVAA